MSVELFRRARRAEARAERAEDRRRLRLEFLRQELAQGFDSLKLRHAERASGQQSVRTHARLMDEVIFSLAGPIAADVLRPRLVVTPLVVAGAGGQGYRRYGASPYTGEPNGKESARGLRDVHTAMWLGAAKFGARTLRELSDKGLITPREQASTDAALTFLWRARNELHFFSGHKN